MKKCLPCIASIALGLLFVMASAMYFLQLGPKPDFIPVTGSGSPSIATCTM